MTTLTCIVDYMSWNVDSKVKMDLGALYGPYLLVCECPSSRPYSTGELGTVVQVGGGADC